MKQNEIKPTPGSTSSRKRVGRGGARGTYSGRGVKGQNARSGGGVRIGFEGGQNPLLRRMPKLKGFKNPNRVEYFPLNVSMLDRFDDGATVDAKALVEKGLLKKAAPVKLLGNGELKKKVTVVVEKASAMAIQKVEKAGGQVTVLESKVESKSKES